jgi:hypothetical protein
MVGLVEAMLKLHGDRSRPMAFSLQLAAYDPSRLTRSPARLDFETAEWRVEKGVSTTVRK